MNRDLDLIAVPWVDDPKDELLLIQQFDVYLTDSFAPDKSDYMFSVLPGGRNSYVINLNREGMYKGDEDPQYYLDISFTPLLVSNQ